MGIMMTRSGAVVDDDEEGGGVVDDDKKGGGVVDDHDDGEWCNNVMVVAIVTAVATMIMIMMATSPFALTTSNLRQPRHGLTN